MIHIQYAFKDGIRYDINDPLVETGQRYLLIDGAIEYQVYPAKGEKNNHHFRSMPGELIEVDRIFHLNCQYYIQDNKKVEIDNLIITCDKVLLEAEAARYIKAKIPDYSMRPDCLFLDSDGEIMCIVEVNVTHAKSYEDIDKIEQYKIPTIELTYGKRKDNHKQPIRAQFLYFYEANENDEELRNRIIKSRGPISELEREHINLKNETTNAHRRELQDICREIEYYECQIQYMSRTMDYSQK